MAGMQETDRLTLKNGITYLLQDAKARAQLADLLTEVMEKYGADNPPPYPVTSVNGQTGAVVLDANDVGALPNTTQIPSKTSDLANDSGFVNAAGAAAAAPVQSVNGQTGAVTVHGVPAGGTTGQVLKKVSNADYDADWENESGGGGSGSGIAIQDDEPTDGELVWIDTDDPGTPHIIPEIDDDNVSPSDTWSSQKIRDFIYPIGSIYMSVNSTSPATIFGGTWEQLEDRFLLAAGTTYSAGSTGGSATMAHTHSTGNHTLTVAEMPSHSHKYTDYYNVSKGTGYKCVAFNLNEDPTGLSVQATGGNGAHNHGNTGAASNDNNMPPYLAVYMWKRTA